jgi:hypothetical protein
MARVLIPITPRRYNYNPRGSSTAQVTMRSDNPFERPTRIVNAPRSMLPGMGFIGEGEDGSAAPTAPADTGFDWTKLLTGVATAATPIAQQVVQNRIQELYGPQPAALVGPTMSLLPGQTGAKLPVMVPPAKKSVVPWAIGGGVLLLGIAALFLMRKKK